MDEDTDLCASRKVERAVSLVTTYTRLFVSLRKCGTGCTVLGVRHLAGVDGDDVRGRVGDELNLSRTVARKTAREQLTVGRENPQAGLTHGDAIDGDQSRG